MALYQRNGNGSVTILNDMQHMDNPFTLTQQTETSGINSGSIGTDVSGFAEGVINNVAQNSNGGAGASDAASEELMSFKDLGYVNHPMLFDPRKMFNGGIGYLYSFSSGDAGGKNFRVTASEMTAAAAKINQACRPRVRFLPQPKRSELLGKVILRLLFQMNRQTRMPGTTGWSVLSIPM